MTANEARGKVVLVTGATDGLGRALAVELAGAGATVLVLRLRLGARLANAYDAAARERLRELSERLTT